MAESQNITASALLAVQEQIQRLFTSPTPVDAARYAPGASYNALATENRVASQVFRDHRGRCQGLKVYHIPYSIGSEATIGTSAPSVNCTITPAEFPTTAETTYSPNFWGNKVVSVNDDVCGDLFANVSTDGATRAAAYVAQQLADGMQVLRNGLDKYIATFLHNNRQTSNFAPSVLPYMVFNTTTQSWDLDFPRFETPDTFTGIRSMMANNGIGDYFMLGGIGSFYNAFNNSQYRQLNDNERFLVRFGTERLAFDIFNLDAAVNVLDGTTDQAYTFAVGQGSYAFVNYTDYTPVPTRVATQEKPTWVFTIEDPILRIWDGGTIRPVQYDVHYQAVCAGTDDKVNFTANHSFQIFHKGLLALAPVNTAGRTTIMKMTTTPGV